MKSNYKFTRMEIGVVHYLRLLLIGQNGELLTQSKELKVETSAPPERPIVTLKSVKFYFKYFQQLQIHNFRAANLNYVSVEWRQPRTFGFALISGYRVFVDGISTAVLPSSQTEYTATQGEWCRPYGFQVQVGHNCC